MQKIFKINNKKFSVNIEKNLLPFLNKTSRGTNYWDSPPSSNPSQRQFGRILLQIHQILSLTLELDINLNNKNFLDVGTGNGMIPRLMNELSGVKQSFGIDPYLDGEHKTSWQKHAHEKLFNRIKRFFISNNKYLLNYKKYKKFISAEQFKIIPTPLKIYKQKKKPYIFKKIDIQQASFLKPKFDFVYCKALEHISNYESFFKNANKCLKNKGYFYIKHRSFFSYLGAHRYASTGIPWGHVLLKEKEYVKYCRKFHKKRASEMIDFYFNGLSYPRFTVSEIVKIANLQNLDLIFISNEANRYKNKIFNKIRGKKNFWEIVWKNFPRVSAEELLSGMFHIILQKNEKKTN